MAKKLKKILTVEGFLIKLYTFLNKTNLFIWCLKLGVFCNTICLVYCFAYVCIRKSTVAHKCHGKTFFLTAKLSFSRQNTLSHGKILFLTAKHSFSRQNTLSHGKTLFLTAKHSFSRQNFLSHGNFFILQSNFTTSQMEGEG